MGIISKATVEKQRPKMWEFCERRGNGGSGRVAGRKSGVVGEGSERERDNVEEIVVVGHTFDAVPAAAADVGDLGGPVVAGGGHNVVDGGLLGGVGADGGVVEGEAGLGAVDEGGGRGGIGDDDGEGGGEGGGEEEGEEFDLN